MENQKISEDYFIGLDIGDTSIGWAVIGEDFNVVRKAGKRLIGTRLYQFTAIDEYSRKRYLEGFSDNSSYSQHGISDLRSNAYRRITDRSLPRRSVRDTLKERNFNRRYSKRYCDRWEYGISRYGRIRRDTTEK